MKRIAIVALILLFILSGSACSLYEPEAVIIIQNGTTAPTSETTPTVTTPVETTPMATTPAPTTPTETAPVATTPVETTPIVTTPAATTPVATTPTVTTPTETIDWNSTHFVVNTNTKKFHVPTCRYAEQIKAENRKEVVGTDEFTEEYAPCKVCLPNFILE
ncbi:MAG: hypothetical protein IJY12_02890 [Clostridia bacterium]|nr:hypothetical protein [Clostridia bacterium]